MLGYMFLDDTRATVEYRIPDEVRGKDGSKFVWSGSTRCRWRVFPDAAQEIPRRSSRVYPSERIARTATCTARPLGLAAYAPTSASVGRRMSAADWPTGDDLRGHARQPCGGLRAYLA